METVELGRRFAAPARAAWRIVSDFFGEALTGGYIERVEASGTGIGAERIYHLAPHLGGGIVREQLEELDDTRMYVRYSMTDNGPVPWTEYSGENRVIAAGPEACMVSIRTRFLPIGVAGNELRAISIRNIETWFDNLAAALDRGRRGGS